MSDNLPVKRASHTDTLRKLKRYLVLREEGVGFHTACNRLGLPESTVNNARRDDPLFAEAERSARMIYAERHERTLHALADAGDFQSLSKTLDAEMPEKYGKRAEVRAGAILVVVDASNHIDRIAQLKEELERRRADTPLYARETNPYFQTVEDTIEDATEDAVVVE